MDEANGMVRLMSGDTAHGRVLTAADDGSPLKVGVFAFSADEAGNTTWVNWWVYSVGFWDSGPDGNWGFIGDSMDEMAPLPFDYEPDAHGYTKWDGCTEIHEYGTHCCGRESVRAHLTAIGLALTYAETLMGYTLREPGSWVPGEGD